MMKCERQVRHVLRDLAKNSNGSPVDKHLFISAFAEGDSGRSVIPANFHFLDPVRYFIASADQGGNRQQCGRSTSGCEPKGEAQLVKAKGGNQQTWNR